MFQRVFCILTCLYLSLSAFGQKFSYQSFSNITLDAEASNINCFAQDKQGLIWIGSNKGLFSYDGFSSQQHTTEATITQIYCIVMIDDEHLCFGSDKGVFFYNYKTDQYEVQDIVFPTDVRTMVIMDNILWIGSLNGLYRYHLNSRKLENVSLKDNPGLPHETIYSIIRSEDNIYIGTYNGLCRYTPTSGKFEKVALPYDSKRSNQFVNYLLEDKSHKCIWIGTEGNLFKYAPATNKVETLNLFFNNSVKSLSIDHEENLLVGTDNGLYIFNETTNSIQHVVHDSRNDKSLANNIIWSIFTDKEQNIWLGTDYNISLLRFNKAFQFIPISQITGIGDGNRFHSIFKDSRNNFWLGGTNGLIFSTSLSNPESSIWYRMGDSRYPIPHNRIRHIYEDKDRNLWIATDGSISRYDYNRKQFVHYAIVDSTHTYNSNWAYHIFEDKSGRLWIATCLGGIFAVDKQKLMQSQGSYIAERNYTMKDGLSGMFINQIIPDKEGNVWVLLYQNGINKIDTKQNKIFKIPANHGTKDENPNYILCDSDGFIWVGLRGGLVRIDPKNDESKRIKFNEFDNGEILAMVEEIQHIWLSTTDGVWAVDKQNHHAQRLNITNKAFTAGFFDKSSGNIYLGASDELGVLSSSSLKEANMEQPIILTSLFINEELYRPGSNTGNISIRYADNIELNYRQNNLIFEFSDLTYSQEDNNKFVYKLNNWDKEWNVLKQNTNRISYSNLEYGKYQLQISKLDSSGKPSDIVLVFAINITPPWYLTVWAKIIYAFLFLGIILWVVNFFRVRNNLRIERIEKEKTVELSNLKMDFFTNVSHEFKTPLSLIIAPVSKLLLETKDNYKKKQLELVQQNALKLNSLIRQIIDFNRSDNVNSGLILSRVEFVEFARSLFSIYEEGYKDKRLTFSFTSNKDKIYTDIDVLKIEAVLNNLIANACKYTEQGNISLELDYNEDGKNLTIQVADTGMGIPENEIPYVFERFYKSSKTAKDKDGTGIGLYLVKTYTEQHQGEIEIRSEENKGTTITITLPIIENIDISDTAISAIQNENLPRILIVEDNSEIADFIYHILANRYQCEICHNGKQGLDMCLQTIPDLVISDIMMPVMDGLEMTRKIRSNVPTSTIPVILLTAKDDKETELKSIDLNVDVFISKPFDPGILLSRVEQLLTKKQQIENKIRLETLSAPKPIEATSPDEKFLSQINDIIEDKVADPDLNVNSLSTISGIGSKQIYRKIKQLTGMSPVEYIRSVRMKKAAMLLTQNKFTVSEIMYMVGFSNPSYFSKCFQNEFGKTPRQFIETKE
ncbi:signal transduction histidine kinase/ligand-binding sensor domain-containing protein/DNA-binding NarL/FixJ family response regulator [Dysgonomonas sp. PFB1-18]|uniref:hybrid sensor histidine kinase/response regulator transcription factor n=1 Tax=unclassified Dysgonomonas TaxID=2630389 RepID=UPI002474364B|nr:MULTISPECIES: two-component regulator propeller domain-containing protein [unclassified Dysgonomonas]MDH6310432.1 signal transduction histidine kinase/ligand-binding sensor domain-containing protein/DNA-binding NarL/FixJ family response regulator [Dysgonomonas sp. PF1-14]MDH6340743.1 signal transduction histidine kinase/ligand-binding sensor domain-containing protein/DNA-binding NarL/FixJ family response regulator [Dysgonomonas sp. PF1-16]MDH6382363.1 signal transduction histidine kinase/liga